MPDIWTRIPTGDNDPGVWIDGFAWDDDEAYNDGWIAVDPSTPEWVPA